LLIAMMTNHARAMLALRSQVALALALPPGTPPAIRAELDDAQ
jgi:hypothetical protein